MNSMWSGDQLHPSFAKQLEPELRALGRMCLAWGPGWFVYVLRQDDEVVLRIHHIDSLEVRSPTIDALRTLGTGSVGVMFLGEGRIQVQQRAATSFFDAPLGVS